MAAYMFRVEFHRHPLGSDGVGGDVQSLYTCMSRPIALEVVGMYVHKKSHGKHGLSRAQNEACCS